jgi:hypothetical protein
MTGPGPRGFLAASNIPASRIATPGNAQAGQDGYRAHSTDVPVRAPAGLVLLYSALFIATMQSTDAIPNHPGKSVYSGRKAEHDISEWRYTMTGGRQESKGK